MKNFWLIFIGVVAISCGANSAIISEINSNDDLKFNSIYDEIKSTHENVEEIPTIRKKRETYNQLTCDGYKNRINTLKSLKLANGFASSSFSIVAYLMAVLKRNNLNIILNRIQPHLGESVKDVLGNTELNYVNPVRNALKSEKEIQPKIDELQAIYDNNCKRTTTTTTTAPLFCAYSKDISISGAYAKSACYVKQPATYTEAASACAAHNMKLFAITSADIETALNSFLVSTVGADFPWGGNVWTNGEMILSTWQCYYGTSQQVPLYLGSTGVAENGINGGPCLAYRSNWGVLQKVENLCNQHIWFVCEFSSQPVTSTISAPTTSVTTTVEPTTSTSTTTSTASASIPAICVHAKELIVLGAYAKTVCFVKQGLNYTAAASTCAAHNMKLFAITSADIETALNSFLKSNVGTDFPWGGNVWTNGERDAANVWYCYYGTSQQVPLYLGSSGVAGNGANGGPCLAHRSNWGTIEKVENLCSLNHWFLCEYV